MRSKIALAVVAVIVGTGVVLWTWSDTLLLPLPGGLDRWRDPIGPTQVVEWWPSLIDGPTPIDHPLGVPFTAEDEWVSWPN